MKIARRRLATSIGTIQNSKAAELPFPSCFSKCYGPLGPNPEDKIATQLLDEISFRNIGDYSELPSDLLSTLPNTLVLFFT